MSSRKLDEALQITAQPRPLSEELVFVPVAESGLSVDPEELGRQFLSDATEQANFESSHGGGSSELTITEGALTDSSLPGVAWETGDVWEQTVNLSLQSGGLDEARGDEPMEGMSQDDKKQEEAERELSQRMDDVNVTRSVIHDASLLDYETGELGDVASPSIDTDEQAETSRRRSAALEELEATLPTGGLRTRRQAAQ